MQNQTPNGGRQAGKTLPVREMEWQHHFSKGERKRLQAGRGKKQGSWLRTPSSGNDTSRGRQQEVRQNHGTPEGESSSGHKKSEKSSTNFRKKGNREKRIGEEIDWKRKIDRRNMRCLVLILEEKGTPNTVTDNRRLRPCLWGERGIHNLSKKRMERRSVGDCTGQRQKMKEPPT